TESPEWASGSCSPMTRRWSGRAVACCSTPPPDPSHVPAALDKLTRREREVLALVADGLSNDEIAAELTMSAATVKTHVGHLLLKLAARDRAQLVVIAYQSGYAQA